MSEELDLLRRADPVPAHGPHFGDGPLDHRAEQRLELLLHADDERGTRRGTPGTRPPIPGTRPRIPRARPRIPRARPRMLSARRRTPRARLLWGLAATAVVLATTLTALLAGPNSQPAVAAPRPLAVRAHSTAVPLHQMAELAAAAAADGSPGLRRGTHVQSWSLAMSDGKPPVTLPEERVVRWNADDSHTEVVVATDPSRPGRPVLTDGDEDGAPRLVEDGKVLSRTTYPPSWSDAPPEARPPHDPAALRAYLAETLHPRTGSLATPELLDTVKELLDHWTLGARESAALVRILTDAGGLRPVGQVTDRLGRPGQAYVNDGPGERRMLILEPRTGAVLGIETTFARDDPRYGVKAGDVMEYSAWMR
ncbi:CU044_5270 family protein [Streptomyces yokosukanensis]|uniref:CU044_5270 family protein n=1 Tax=Streptomyces yokosukanensis TaxID=67386 RepID=UPI00342690A2